MKKLLYLIAALPFVACNTSSYKINGITQNVADSSIVYLQVYKSDKSIETIDTAYVIKNSFKFKGIWKDIPSNAQLVFKSSGFNPRFILESSSIDFNIIDEINKKYSVSGSENNETFMNLHTTNEVLYTNLNELLKEINSTNSADGLNKIFEEAAAFQTQINNTYINYAMENPEKEISALLIEDLYFKNALNNEILEKFKSLIPKDHILFNKITAYASGRVLSTQIGQVLDIDPFTKLANSPFEYKSAFADKTIVYFWRNYDENNENNFRALQNLYSKFKGEIPVITFNIGRNEVKYKEFIKKHHQFINFTITKTDSEELKNLLQKYQLKHLPQGMLTDKNGKILDMDPTLDYILEPLY